MSAIRMTPITGPKAWRGDRLTNDPSWIVTFTDADIAEMERALTAAKSTGRAMAEIGREQFPLPTLAPKLVRVLDEIRNGRGFVVVRGLPVPRYSDDDVGLILWGLGRYLGTPLHQNPQGDLLGHVYDHGRTYGNIDVRGYETNAYLPYHTDAGDMVGLLCLRRGLEGGLSSIVSSVTVHNEILAQHPEFLGRGLNIDLGFVFRLLSHLQIVQGDCAFVVENLCAFQLSLGQLLVGHRLPVVGKGAGNVGTLHLEQ